MRQQRLLYRTLFKITPHRFPFIGRPGIDDGVAEPINDTAGVDAVMTFAALLADPDPFNSGVVNFVDQRHYALSIH
jgi:hypothetical protein